MRSARWSEPSLLRAVSADLANWQPEEQQGRLCLTLGPGVEVWVEARRQRLFMANLWRCEFSCAGPLAERAEGRVRAHQPGWWRRQPVRFTGRGAMASALARHLNHFPNLRQTLAELDYRQFELRMEGGAWRCVIEPWAASEVACRLPPLRRYLRLTPHQRMLLLSVLKMVAEAMARFPR